MQLTNSRDLFLLETVFDEYDLPGCCAYDDQPTLDTAMRLPEEAQSMKSTVRNPTLAAGGHSWLL